MDLPGAINATVALENLPKRSPPLGCFVVLSLIIWRQRDLEKTLFSQGCASFSAQDTDRPLRAGSRASGLKGEVGTARVSQTPQTLPSTSKDWAQAEGQS